MLAGKRALFLLALFYVVIHSPKKLARLSMQLDDECVRGEEDLLIEITDNITLTMAVMRFCCVSSRTTTGQKFLGRIFSVACAGDLCENYQSQLFAKFFRRFSLARAIPREQPQEKSLCRYCI